MSKRKPMSFGMILGVTLGGFALFVVIGILIVKGIYGPKTTQQTARTPSSRQPIEPSKPVDAVGNHLQMETLMAARTAEQNAQAQREVVERMLSEYQDMIIPQLQASQQETAALRAAVVQMEQRLVMLEGGDGVKVIKPERAPRRDRTTTATARPEGAIDVATTGYTVQAVVGPRAWVTSPSGDFSVTAGDALPPPTKARATATAPSGDVRINPAN